MTEGLLCCAARRFLVAYAVLGALVAWQLATSVLHALAPGSQGVDFGVMCGTLLILAALALVPYRAGGIFSQPAEQKPLQLDTESLDRSVPVLMPSAMNCCTKTLQSLYEV